jgi:hypothetical protein
MNILGLAIQTSRPSDAAIHISTSQRMSILLAWRLGEMDPAAIPKATSNESYDAGPCRKTVAPIVEESRVAAVSFRRGRQSEEGDHDREETERG